MVLQSAKTARLYCANVNTCQAVARVPGSRKVGNHCAHIIEERLVPLDIAGTVVKAYLKTRLFKCTYTERSVKKFCDIWKRTRCKHMKRCPSKSHARPTTNVF